MFNLFKKKELKTDYYTCKQLKEKDYPKYLKKIYYEKTGKELNLKNPTRFTEKIQYLKLYDSTDIKTELSDKIKAKKWIADKNLELYTAKIFSIGKKYEDIDFKILPSTFALKTNHGYRTTKIIFDKSLFLKNDQQKIATVYNQVLKHNYAFESGFELQYNNIEAQIYAEEIISIKDTINFDYRIHCFNSKPYFIEHNFIIDNKTTQHFYNTNWELQSFCYLPNYITLPQSRPEKLEEILYISKILSKNFKYVRIDFIVIKDKIIFFEMTFTPFSGFMIFNNEKYDYYFGKLLEL